MSHSIVISYPGDAPVDIKVSYKIEVAENVQTIACCVEEKHFPLWLQLKKFDLLSIKDKNRYTPLFNEVNNSRNMATSLFIDMAYTDIMQAERFEINKSGN